MLILLISAILDAQKNEQVAAIINDSKILNLSRLILEERKKMNSKSQFWSSSLPEFMH